MASPEPPRTTLDRYELVERIAVGGMAEVFRAKAFGAHGFEKVLAIKRILPDLAKDPEFESRFIAEAKLAVALAHANIVQVLDFGRFGGTLYIAMELVDGPDLAALLRALAERGERVPVSAALHIAMDLAKGLDFAHRHGVVHRDVSPSNVLLSRSGEVKIADFGIALAAESAPAASGVRRIMGKWRYMSPEQARGEKLDARSDLFSLGVVLYELFTGKKLFPGDDIEEVVRNVRDMPILAPSAVRPDVPPALDAVLAKCLERDPAARWGQASELYRALLELSYARTLVVTATDVAELIAEVLPARAGGGVVHGPGSGSGSAGSAGSGGRGGRGRRPVDDLIRAELLGGVGLIADDEATSEVSRITAAASSPPHTPSPDPVTQTTFVLRGVGPDGVTQFDIAPPDAAPDSLSGTELRNSLSDAAGDAAGQAAGREESSLSGTELRNSLSDAAAGAGPSRRPLTGAGPAGSSLSGTELRNSLSDAAAGAGPSRRPLTGAGPPPAAGPLAGGGPAPAVELLVAPNGAASSSVAPPAPTSVPATAADAASGSRLPRRAAAAAVLIAAIVGVAIWRVGGGGTGRERTPVAASAVDAGPARLNAAYLEVVTEPPGATVFIGDVAQPARTPTVLTLPSAANDTHRLELRLAGHRTFVSDVTVRPGERLRYERPLEPARAALRVVTDPVGATVTLDGQSLGQTPLSLADVPADGAVHTLRLSRPGFRDLEVPVELADRANLTVEQTLEPEVRWGKINLQVDPWAYVYFEGKRIAEAPVAGLKLPVGKQKLRLVNPAMAREKNVLVDVPVRGVGTETFDMN